MLRKPLCLGTLIGTLIVGIFRNGLQLMGVAAIYQFLITGVLVIVAVAVDQLSLADSADAQLGLLEEPSWRLSIKRLIDVVLAAAALIALAPLFAVIAALVRRLTSSPMRMRIWSTFCHSSFRPSKAPISCWWTSSCLRGTGWRSSGPCAPRLLNRRSSPYPVGAELGKLTRCGPRRPSARRARYKSRSSPASSSRRFANSWRSAGRHDRICGSA